MRHLYRPEDIEKEEKKMSHEDRYDIQDLQREALAILDEYPQSDDYSDLVHEIADSLVPVYSYDIVQYAANDITLATDEPEIGPAFDGSPTPVNIIAANIYERLVTALNEELAARDDEDKE